jgi:hypothetical protein
MLSMPIAASENIERDRKEFVIDPTRVKCERSH